MFVRRRFRALIGTAAALTFVGTVILIEVQAAAAEGDRQALSPQATGREIYGAACATCHRADGKGAPRSVVGFAAPIPDFTDCAYAAREPDADWQAVVHQGGPVRGLDRHMPAFGDALSTSEIARVVTYLRTFCSDRAWPRGELNFPRAFFTRKAFPENELRWEASATLLRLSGSPFERSLDAGVAYERRLGPRVGVEISAPLHFHRGDGGRWNRGVGDVELSVKRAVFADLARGRIGAVGLQVSLPTGKAMRGLGSGQVIANPFVAAGWRLGSAGFMQFHAGATLPRDAALISRTAHVSGALGGTLARAPGFGRQWSPQVELLWARPEHRRSEWDIVPQVQVSLSKLQRLRLAAAVRVPINVRYREGRRLQGMTSLQWDWADGPLFGRRSP